MSLLKLTVIRILPPIVLDFLIFIKKKFTNKKNSTYSFLDEQTIIEKYLAQIAVSNKFCVDIAASDGTTMSNTYALKLNVFPVFVSERFITELFPTILVKLIASVVILNVISAVSFTPILALSVELNLKVQAFPPMFSNVKFLQLMNS